MALTLWLGPNEKELENAFQKNNGEKVRMYKESSSPNQRHMTVGICIERESYLNSFQSRLTDFGRLRTLNILTTGSVNS